MSAELYLAETIQRAQAQYGALDHLIDQMHALSHHQIEALLLEQVQAVFTHLQTWASQGPLDLDLFDAVSQFRDLVQGEAQAWLRSLIAEQVTAMEVHAPATPALALAQQMQQLAQEHTEEQVPLVLIHLQELLAQEHPRRDEAMARLAPLVAVVLHQEHTEAVAQCQHTHMQTAQAHQAEAIMLDTLLVEQARRLYRASNALGTARIFQMMQHWQRVSQDLYTEIIAGGYGALFETVTASNKRSSTFVREHQELFSTVAQELIDVSNPLPAILAWFDLSKTAAQRMAFAKRSEQELVQSATICDALARGEAAPWLQAQAAQVIEALQPPSDLPVLEPLAIWEEDVRPTMLAWKQLQIVTQQKVLQQQEQESEDHAFCLAVQLRDLLHQDPGSRLRWVASDFVTQVTVLEKPDLLLHARAIAGLVAGEPHGQLLLLIARILTWFRDRQRAAEPFPSALLEQASAMGELLIGDVMAALRQLMAQVEPFLQEERTPDPDLRNALHGLPALIEQEDDTALQNGLHLVMARLQDLLFPPEASFLDPYNPAGLLLRLDLDWWRDVIPRVDPATNLLPLEAVRWLYEQVQEAQIQPVTEEEYQRFQQMLSDRGEVLPPLEAWETRLHEKKAQLLQFLDRAITHQEPLWCDL